MCLQQFHHWLKTISLWQYVQYITFYSQEHVSTIQITQVWIIYKISNHHNLSDLKTIQINPTPRHVVIQSPVVTSLRTMCRRLGFTINITKLQCDKSNTITLKEAEKWFWEWISRFNWDTQCSLLPHLALLLFVPSKELPNLIQNSRVLLLAAQPEGALRRAACRSHGASSSRWDICICQMWLVISFQKETDGRGRKQEKRGRREGKASLF